MAAGWAPARALRDDEQVTVLDAGRGGQGGQGVVVRSAAAEVRGPEDHGPEPGCF